MESSVSPNAQRNRSIGLSIVLSIIATLLLWGITAAFNITGFWTFVLAIGIIFAIFYFLVPWLEKNQMLGF